MHYYVYAIFIISYRAIFTLVSVLFIYLVFVSFLNTPYKIRKLMCFSGYILIPVISIALNLCKLTIISL